MDGRSVIDYVMDARSVHLLGTNGEGSSTLALQLCHGDGQRVVRLLSLALTLSGLVELGMSPWVGMICDRYGRKPLLIVGGSLRVIP